MKKGWPTVPIGEACPITNRKPSAFTGTRPYFSTGAVGSEGVLSQPEFVDFSNRPSRAGCMPEVGDIGFARMKGTKKVILIGESVKGALFSTGFCFVAPQPYVEPRFAFYFITSDSFQCTKNEVAGDGIMGGIKNADAAVIRMPLPPLPEQQRIVHILDEAFESIANARADLEKNLRNAGALFESALDSAIAGKLTQEWRRMHTKTVNASTGLSRRLTERCKRWEETGTYQEPDVPVTLKSLRLPEGWVLAAPNQIATHIVDCPHSTPKWAESGVICLRTSNFKPGFLDLKSVRFVSQQTYKERIKRLEPQPGDVLYSREGGIMGIACMVPDGLRTCLGQRMMLFRTDSVLVLPEYFTAVLNSSHILSEVRRLTGGAASPHLNIRDIRKFPIPLPPIAEQSQIVSKLGALSAETRRLTAIYERKLAALGALKKSLLNQAFAGEL